MLVAEESGSTLTAVELVGFIVNPDTDPDRQEQVTNLLKCYEEYFAEDWQVQKDDGGYRGIHYECHLGPKVSSAVCQREMMNTTIADLLKYGIIKRTESTHDASAILVPRQTEPSYHKAALFDVICRGTVGKAIRKHILHDADIYDTR